MRAWLLISALWFACGITASAQQDTLWTQTFGGPGADGARALVRTDDGGYAVAGYTHSQGAGGADAYLIRTDASGRLLWAGTYGGPGRDYVQAVCQAPDGGYFLVGHSTSFGVGKMDIYLVKTDAQGQEAWSTTFGGPSDDAGYSLCGSPDGNIIICGQTASSGAGQSDICLIKAHAEDGHEIWSRTFGGVEADRASEVRPISTGGYIIVGTSGPPSPPENRDIQVIRTDAEGYEIWNELLGAQGNCDWGSSVCEARDGGFAILGHGDIHSADLQDIFLYKLDADGGSQWFRRFGQGAYYDYGRGICATQDGGFLICGATKIAETGKNDLYVVKTDSLGAEEWAAQYGGTGSDWGSAVIETGIGTYAVAGHTDSFGAGRADVWLLNLYEPTAQGMDGGRGPGGQLHASNPNPTRSATTLRFYLAQPGHVKLDIVNPAGQQVASIIDDDRREGDHQVRWQPENLPSGIYFSVLRVANRVAARELVLLR
jgi:hypothetical protein